MSKKGHKPFQYCRITDWIERHDPNFAGMLRHMCLDGSLSTNPRRPAVTFLYPEDEKYRAELIDRAYDDADAAAPAIKGLIVPDALMSASDFSRDVGGLNEIKYEVEDASGPKVKLVGGVELELAGDFKTREWRNGTLAVWLIKKGRLPTTGAPYAPPARERPGRAKGHRGGGVAAPFSQREQLGCSTESAFNSCMLRDGCRTHDPYIARTVSLLNFLSSRNPAEFEKVAPLIDPSPFVTFYLLVEPYKRTGEYLLADSLLFGPDGWNGTELYGDAVAEYKTFLKAPAAPAASASDPQSGAAVVPFMYRDPGRVASQIDLCRQQYNRLDPRSGPDYLHKGYKLLEDKNTIQGLGPILPTATLRAIAGKKFWQDQLRFILRGALREVRTGPYDPNTFRKVTQDLRLSFPGDDYARELMLANTDRIKRDVAPRAQLMVLLKFVNSTDLFYTRSAGVSGGAERKDRAASRKGPVSPIDPNDVRVYDGAAESLAVLSATTGMVNPDGVSPGTMRELQIYTQRHGKLPDAVLRLKPQ